ncbi:MAG: prolipoprotein diacylglyceryl transferase [Planctomycetota bacterium]
MRPLLYELVFGPFVALFAILVTLGWSVILLRPMSVNEALKRAVQSLVTFGSKGSTEKTDISVPGSLGTVALALGIYGIMKEPVHLPLFGYAAMAFLGFSVTAACGWKTGPRLGVPPETAIRVAFLCAFFGILGSRLFFVAQFHDQFEAQPARVSLGRLRPQKDQTLVVQSERGSTQVTFAGDEDTQPKMLAKLGGVASVGVTAKINSVKRRERDELLVIDRGIDLESMSRGPTAHVLVSGTALNGHAESTGYAPPWWEVFAIWHGGLVYYGGMVFGTAAVLIFVRLQGQRVGQIADLASSVGAVGIAFGRVGCFLNGCCWGRRAELPWSVRFPVSSPAWLQHVTSVLGAEWNDLIGNRQIQGAPTVHPLVANELTRMGASELCTGSWPLHPVQVYAILLDLGMFAILFPFALYKVKREWQTFFLWFIVYGFVRFIIEHFRGDHDQFTPVLGYPLTPSQQVAVVTIPFAVAGFVWASKKGRLIVPWTSPAPPSKP